MSFGELFPFEIWERMLLSRLSNGVAALCSASNSTAFPFSVTAMEFGPGKIEVKSIRSFCLSVPAIFDASNMLAFIDDPNLSNVVSSDIFIRHAISRKVISSAISPQVAILFFNNT